MSKPRLIKFDGVHPIAYLELIKKEEAGKIASMSFGEYHQWLMDKKINYSDFYSHNLNQHGWEAIDFVLNDPLYIEKASELLFGKKKAIIKFKESLKNKLRPSDHRWHKFVTKSFIEKYRPDVIFVREGNPFASSFWSEFSNDALLVSRIAMNFPKIWNPMYFDLIFTSLESYKEVFESNGIPTYLFYDGFDQRINQSLEGVEKSIDISHAGGAGKHIFREKTELFEAVATKFDFHWYGWGKEKLNASSPLLKAWRGFLSGIDMYRLYKKSRIVLNDYGNIAKGVAVNQRIYEVLGIGSFLLTREAENLSKFFPSGIFATFKDEADCLSKIQYYLEHEEEREAIARAGKAFAAEQLDYGYLMGKMDVILREHLQKKFPRKDFS